MTDVEHPAPEIDYSTPATGLERASDPELIALVRAGDAAAYEQLFLRHRSVAIRYARRIADAERAEDLCSEAFMKIFDLLQRGKGPDVAFRAYLLTTVRTSHLNTVRLGQREQLVPDHEPISRMTPVIEDPDERFDQDAICRAFYTLPERWQAALWLTAVEGLTNDEIGERLGIRSNAVASLAFRARAGLRDAYLSQHLLATDDPKCRQVLEHLPSHMSGTLTDRRSKAVEEHLETCRTCATAALEINQVHTELGGLLAPLVFFGLGVGGAAVIVPAKASGLVVLGLTTTKGGIAAVVGKAKALGTAAPGAVGSKVAIAASVTALGLAVGSQVIRPHHEAPAPHEVTFTAPEQLRATAKTVAPRPTAAPSIATVVFPAPTAVVPTTAPVTREIPPVVAGPTYTAPTSAAPTTGPTPPAPTSGPVTPASTPTAAPTTTAPVAARAMRVEPMTDESYTRNGVRWEQVTVPVSNPAKGTMINLTTTRTIRVDPASTTGTGWICGTPTTNWIDGLVYSSTRISCVYSANGNGGPIRLDYQVATKSVLTAALTPPAGFLDTSLLDNLGSLDLRP